MRLSTQTEMHKVTGTLVTPELFFSQMEYYDSLSPFTLTFSKMVISNKVGKEFYLTHHSFIRRFLQHKLFLCCIISYKYQSNELNDYE